MNPISAVMLAVIILVATSLGAYVYKEQHQNTPEFTTGNEGIKVEGTSN